MTTKRFTDVTSSDAEALDVPVMLLRHAQNRYRQMAHRAGSQKNGHQGRHASR